ncbi:unnamed protein product [Acanthoscelides obtectus]|uniref:UHRF1 tandem tudor domain-containing protein n=1 Tax=Acanthoscelides obtectus TaxID=200917 RepID=A0A9P0PSU1_ACAOB|nr:unnamed protein product [Acanthoscelides obtectus]
MHTPESSSPRLNDPAPSDQDQVTPNTDDRLSTPSCLLSVQILLAPFHQQHLAAESNAPHVEDFQIDALISDIRPRSYYAYRLSELKRDMVVLVNYNIGNPLALGNWYDFIIEEVSRTANIRGTVLLGGDRKPIAGCYVRIEHGIMRIEKTVKLRERSTENITHLPSRFIFTQTEKYLRE